MLRLTDRLLDAIDGHIEAQIHVADAQRRSSAVPQRSHTGSVYYGPGDDLIAARKRVDETRGELRKALQALEAVALHE